jgi:hypothetical protein
MTALSWLAIIAVFIGLALVLRGREPGGIAA